MSKMQSTETALPLSRIRMIMKSSLNTGQISNEVLFLMTKATELFAQDFSKEAYKRAKGQNTLRYEHLAQYVQEDDKMEFLLQVVPAKIKVKEFKKILESQENSDSEESDSESE